MEQPLKTAAPDHLAGPGPDDNLPPGDHALEVAARSGIVRAIGRPERIGRYRILRIIGEGGMGTVYEAEQEKPKRTVALKVITPGFASAPC